MSSYRYRPVPKLAKPTKHSFFARHMFVPVLASSVASLVSPALSQAQGLDDVQLKLSQQLPQIVRWDSIEPQGLGLPSPYLLTPVAMQAHAGLDWRSLRLEAGQSIQIRLPRGASLRLQGLPGLHGVSSEAIANIEMWRSSGNGLAVRETAQAVAGGVQPAADLQHENVVTLMLAQDAPAVEVGVFVSRLEERDNLVAYRHLQEFSGAALQLRGERSAATQKYWSLQTAQEVKLTGPARYMLQGRWQYAQEDNNALVAWQVALTANGEQLAPLRFLASAESSEMQWLGEGSHEQPTLLSREKAAYFDLPAGEHLVRLQSNGPFLARLLRQAPSDYSLPEINAQLDFTRAQSSEREKKQLKKSPWDTPASALQDAVNGTSTALSQQAASRIAQDNRHREGGMLAAQALLAQAQYWRDANQVHAEAQQFLQHHSHWRDLLPQEKISRNAPQLAWYSQARLQRINQSAQSTIIAAQHTDALLDGLHSGRFFALEKGVQEYLLPARSSDSSLHLAVHSQAQTHLRLQFDEGSVRELRLTPPVAANLLANDPALSALQMQQLTHGEFGGSTLSAAFAKGRTPAKQIAAQVLEVALPRDVQKIKIWQISESASESVTTPWLAVKLRESRPYLLDEAALLDVLQQSSSLTNLTSLLSALPKLGAASSENEPNQLSAAPEILSQLQPLMRLLVSQANSYTAQIELGSTLSNQPESVISSKQAAELSAQARQLASSGSWLPALEKWAEVRALATANQDEANRGQLAALRALGETFLYEQGLKKTLFGYPSASEQEFAYQELMQYYQQNLDERAQLALVSSRLIQLANEPEATSNKLAVLKELIPVLQANSQPQLALLAGLLLPAKQRPLGAMLEMALQNNWPRVFASLQASLATNAEREYWQALALARAGKFSEAQSGLQLSQELSSANSTSKLLASNMANHLQEGLQIHQIIQSARNRQLPLSNSVLTRWATWQAEHPGTRTWQEMNDGISDYAASYTLYSINRDTSATSFLATAEKPVKLRVLGPLKLRVEARPLHPKHSKVALDSWLNIREPARQLLWPVAITQNWPAQGLQIIGRSEHLPGHAVLKEIELDAGWHELEIQGTAGGKAEGEAQAMLINVQAAQVGLALPVLPPISAELAADSRASNAAQASLEFLPNQRPWYAPWQAECEQCSTMLSNGTVQRWRVRAPAQLGKLSSASFTSSTLANSNYPLQHALASENWDALLEMSKPSDAKAVTDYLQALLWRLEHYPQQKQRVLALASQLQVLHPDLPQLGTLMARMLRDSDWQHLPSVQTSAGQRSRAITQWEPENPAIRVRRALLQGIQPSDYLLSGGNRLVLSLFNLQAGQVKFLLKNRDVSGMPGLPLTAQIQLGNGAIHSLPIAADSAGQELSLAIGKGQQAIKVWLKNPVTNQFLSVQVLENSAKSANSGKQVIDASERFYHVATHQEPIKLNIAGPVWLRLDQWRDGQTHSRYQLLNEEWNKLVLAPRPEQKEAMFRFFTRQVTPSKPQTPARQVEVAVLPVPAPLVQMPEVAPLQSIGQEQTANFPLGGQEAGTWSVHASYLQQDAKQGKLDNLNKLSNSASFASGASYRFADTNRQNWYRADVFARHAVNAASSPTSLGAVASILHDPRWQGISLGAEASLLLHQASLSNTLRWQAGAQVYVKQSREISPLTSHEPRLALLLRQATEAKDASNLLGDSGAQHSANSNAQRRGRNLGIEISDTFNYRPWLDSVFSAQAKVASGRNLLPDVFSAKLSAKQLVGATVLGVQYDTSMLRSDGARMFARTTRAISLSAASEIWLKQQHRLEVAFNLQHDLGQHRSSGGIALVWHFGNGRGYKDFQPEEIMFRELRQRRAPEAKNGT